MDNRGQASSFPVGPFIGLGIVGIVVIVGIQGMQNVSEQTSADEVEHLCAGVFGCTGPSTSQIVGMLGLAAGILLAAWWLNRKVPEGGDA